MTGPLSLLPDRLTGRVLPDSDGDVEDDEPDTELYECTGCGSVFIQSSDRPPSGRCSNCGTEDYERV